MRVILYTNQDFAAEVKRLTNGKGVNVVYDSVGQTTFEKSLNSLAPSAIWCCTVRPVVLCHPLMPLF